MVKALFCSCSPEFHVWPQEYIANRINEFQVERQWRFKNSDEVEFVWITESQNSTKELMKLIRQQKHWNYFVQNPFDAQLQKCVHY